MRCALTTTSLRNLYRLQVCIRCGVSEDSEHRHDLTFVVKCVGYDVKQDKSRTPKFAAPIHGTLGYSRKSVRLLSWRSSARIWAELHEKAFRRLGACPRVVVLDNLKEGVSVPDIYDPTVNPLFREVLAHYGVATPRTQKITSVLSAC